MEALAEKVALDADLALEAVLFLEADLEERRGEGGGIDGAAKAGPEVLNCANVILVGMGDDEGLEAVA